MSDNSELRNEDDNEAVQAVVDRVLSYQGGAPVDTVRGGARAGAVRDRREPARGVAGRDAEEISKADPAQS